MLATEGPGPSTAAPRALSLVSTHISDEEIGRKRVSPHELSGAVSANESPSSRPPPDKCNNVPRSVIIPVPTKVGYNGNPDTTNVND